MVALRVLSPVSARGAFSQLVSIAAFVFVMDTLSQPARKNPTLYLQRQSVNVTEMRCDASSLQEENGRSGRRGDNDKLYSSNHGRTNGSGTPAALRMLRAVKVHASSTHV